MSPSCPFRCVSLSLSRVRNFPLIHCSCTTPMYPLVAIRTCTHARILPVRTRPLARTYTRMHIRMHAYDGCTGGMLCRLMPQCRICDADLNYIQRFIVLSSPFSLFLLYCFIRLNKKFAHNNRRKIAKLFAKRVTLRTTRSVVAPNKVRRNSQLQFLSYLPRKISQDYVLIRTVRGAAQWLSRYLAFSLTLNPSLFPSSSARSDCFATLVIARGTNDAIIKVRVTVRITHDDFLARNHSCTRKYSAMVRCHLYQRYSYLHSLAEAILRSLSEPPQESQRARSLVERTCFKCATSTGGHAQPTRMCCFTVSTCSTCKFRIIYTYVCVRVYVISNMYVYILAHCLQYAACCHRDLSIRNLIAILKL